MKTFVKFLLLAQAASDAGKGFISSKAQSAGKAIKYNYGLKDSYIKQAISEAKKLQGVVRFGSSTDSNGMSVVLFDIKGFGQVSFHSFTNFVNFVPQGLVDWNGIRGGSIRTCQKLAKKYNLPFYKHG